MAIGDIDSDGRPDVYFVSGPARIGFIGKSANSVLRILRNRPESTEATPGAGVAMADVNDDGRLDIYVCNYDSPNQLYINQGNGKFVEKAIEFGLATVDACLMAAFADYDLDGDLDMYLLTNRFVPPNGRPATPPVTSVAMAGRRFCLNTSAIRVQAGRQRR